ncbi:protein-methionine-sulfoxide reductase heme-binding subunit MsrQ [Loktanella sp. D2R18]|uniref:protein-methionine-sulfoxide reductase heme-binding subunit MsrQ n=1 Tax=Rhodobacterales TaxID=204455 RepID=UPI000DEA2874|nr:MULTISPECIES: protein-methionine-sulfoxide reductase heme-binding subunit MsrQ [Rhodobacterales]MDO6591472.1 protein-methionine-sulfoxide reductase heme-binding subunit MsrQ [Yoonia sp. 1_MG-2023]RBW43465.1 protein-methionine-sulfoxide reductase heme-binding subunit MsrQ [Loktanella sp. D2R18]
MILSQTINSGLRKIPTWTIYIVGGAWVVWMFYLAATNQMGPEPINALEREYGELGLKLIVLGLAVTPLRRWTGLNLMKFRRAIGVTAFFVVLAHFLVWALLDVGTFGRMWTEIVKRPYVTVGMASFIMLIPLAVTSNNLSIRKLGGATWRKLHKLTYPIALCAVVHYLWLVKGFQIEPFVYLGIVILLLALRQSGFKWPTGTFKPRAIKGAASE